MDNLSHSYGSTVLAAYSILSTILIILSHPGHNHNTELSPATSDTDLDSDQSLNINCPHLAS